MSILKLVGYFELQSRADVSAFLQKHKKGNLRDGTEVAFKQAITGINRSRNWALRTSNDLVKSAGAVNPKINWKDRTVETDEGVAFKQGPTDLRGNFSGTFTHLSLP